MAGKINIRTAAVEDIPSIIEIWKEIMDLHKELDRIFSRSADGHEKFADFIKEHIPNVASCILVAEAGGDIVGYCLALIEKYPPVIEAREYCSIQNIAVTEKYRHMGIGKRFLEEVRDLYREKGIRRFEARVSKFNNVSMNFWAKMGFTPYLETVFREIE